MLIDKKEPFRTATNKNGREDNFLISLLIFNCFIALIVVLIIPAQQDPISEAIFLDKLMFFHYSANMVFVVVKAILYVFSEEK